MEVYDVDMIRENSFIRTTMSLHLKMYGLILFYLVFSKKKLIEVLPYIFLILLNALSFTKVALGDPGKVHKKKIHKYSPETLHFGKNISVGLAVNKNNAWVKRIIIDNVEYEQKYCLECNIFRINGMGHCRDCGCCIFEMDHHCGWFSNCVGRNNIKIFHIYLYSLLVILGLDTKFSYELVLYTLNLNHKYKICILVCFCLFLAMSLLSFLVILFFTSYNIILAIFSIRSREYIKGESTCNKINLKKIISSIATIKPTLEAKIFTV